MKTPLEQAKDLHNTLKKEGSVESLHRLLEFMAQYSGEDEVVLSTDLLEEIKKFENEERYYTGIDKLDEILDGFRSNQVIVLSAPTKAGKTQFSVHIARKLPNPTMFLFEESAPEVLYKYHKKGIPLPRFYTPQSVIGMNIDDVYRKMIEAWAKYESRIFFIDHLHYLLDDGSENTTHKIKKVMQELKEFAKRHSFTIFLIAHIKHQTLTEPPGIEDIRDSSFIPQYADTTIMLWRETYNPGVQSHKKIYSYTNNLLVNVALNRKINFKSDRNTGLVDLTFNSQTWGYEPSDWYSEWIEGNRKDAEATNDIIKKLRV